MSAVKFDIKGIDKLQKKISELPKELQEEVVGEIQAWGYDVNAEQIGLISQQKIQDLGALQQNTKAVPKPDGVELISNVYYAPYIEFGTRSKVRVPAELNDYASQFRGKKRGDYYDFLNAILDWVKRKGIAARYSVKTRKALNSKADKERLINTAQMIANSILRNGISPRPYFFPPYLRKRKELLSRINTVIKRVV
jgi:hypothetical protein